MHSGPPDLVPSKYHITIYVKEKRIKPNLVLNLSKAKGDQNFLKLHKPPHLSPLLMKCFTAGLIQSDIECNTEKI